MKCDYGVSKLVEIYESINKDNIDDILSKIDYKHIYIKEENILIRYHETTPATTDTKSRYFQIIDLENANKRKLKCPDIVWSLAKDRYPNQILEFLWNNVILCGWKLSDLFDKDKTQAIRNRLKLVFSSSYGLENVMSSIPSNEVYSPLGRISIPTNFPERDKLMTKDILALLSKETVRIEVYDKKTRLNIGTLYDSNVDMSVLVATYGFKVEMYHTREYFVGLDFSIKRKDNNKYIYRINYCNEEKFKSQYDEFVKEIRSNQIKVIDIPVSFLDDNLIFEIINKNAYNIEHLPQELLVDKYYLMAVGYDGGLLALVPDEKITIELCKVALENDEIALNFIPEKYKKLLKGIA